MKHTSPSHRVVITGSESTGKTALAKALAEYFDCPYSPEAARLYLEDHDRMLTVDDVGPIATRQMELEETAIRQALHLVIHDTDLLSTLIYAQHYYGESPEWLRNTAKQRVADLYLLCDIDLPWKPDGLQRDSGSTEQRRDIHQQFIDLLENSGQRWSLIQGNGKARFERAFSVIEKYLGR
jgi:NadR type nicotinamide-nucleotide adenylyltransferase